jgi:hypothetical protein
VITCEICRWIGLPHVTYQFAELWDGAEQVSYGVVCQNMVRPPSSLVLGNQLLFERDESYPASNRFRVKAHTFNAVWDVLGRLKLPSDDWMPNRSDLIGSAADVFVGYILLDALVANQDRHHENWAAIRDCELRLAPTFDHGSGLARNLTDDKRRIHLTTKDRNP